MIRALHKQLCDGAVTARSLAERAIARIHAKDQDIHAFLTITEESALAHADRVDNAIRSGRDVDLLAGIPYAVKDAICTRGVRTTASAKMLDGYIPPYDATVIERLEERGAVMIGKTNMDEFAMGSSTENSAYGRTTHPSDVQRVPGGSSGGSAASVASEEVIWALGSDTGGSIRQPASFCGVVGLKPTYGRVSRYGLIAMASSLDQIGPLTRTVEDAAIVLSRLAGEDRRDATSAPSGGKFYEDYITRDRLDGLRIGVVTIEERLLAHMDRRIVTQSAHIVEKMSAAGATIVPVTLTHLAAALPTYYVLMPSEVSSNLARFDGIRYGLSVDDGEATKGMPKSALEELYRDTRRVGFGPESVRRILLGTYALSAGYYDAYYKTAQRVRTLIQEDFARAFAGVDLLYLPTSPEVAFRAGAKTDDPLTMYLSDIFTVPANLAGVPALSLPIGHVREEGVALSVGGQFMAKWFDEETLLSVAHVVERICEESIVPAS